MKPISQLRRRQAGLSLLELMIAIAIGLFLLVGLVSVFATSNRNYLELSRSQQQIENGRFATTLLSDDVGLAGYYGQYPISVAVPGAMPDPCEAANMANLRAAMGMPVQGYNNPAHPLAAPISGCIADANHVEGTDILVVRRADSKVTALASLTAADVYMQSNAADNDPANPVMATGTAANFTLLDRLAVNPAPARKYHVHVYFIAPCSIPNGGGSTCTGANDDGGNPVQTLKRLELSVDPADNTLKMVTVSLVEGIENFQVDYGVDTDGDGVLDGAYTQAPATVVDWTNVVAIRLNVLARNIEPSNAADPKVYDMGLLGNEYAPGGNYKRHVYNAAVRLVNPSARRETP
jgi:type IV pilus assembly protein PilW